MATEAETGAMQPQAEGCWQPPEAGRDKEQKLPRDTLVLKFCPLELWKHTFLFIGLTNKAVVFKNKTETKTKQPQKVSTLCQTFCLFKRSLLRSSKIKYTCYHHQVQVLQKYLTGTIEIFNRPIQPSIKKGQEKTSQGKKCLKYNQLDGEEWADPRTERHDKQVEGLDERVRDWTNFGKAGEHEEEHVGCSTRVWPNMEGLPGPGWGSQKQKEAGHRRGST